MVRTPPNVERFFHCLWLSDNHSVVTTCASAGTFEKSGDLSPSWNRVYIVGLFWMVCVLDAGCSFSLSLYRLAFLVSCICPPRTDCLLSSACGSLCLWQPHPLPCPYLSPCSLLIAVSFAPSGKYLAALLMEDALALWTAPSGPHQIHNLLQHSNLQLTPHNNQTGRWLSKLQIHWDAKVRLSACSDDRPRKHATPAVPTVFLSH